MRPLPETVSITEVGLRDGLQIEPRILATDEKVRLAKALIAAGHRSLEATSFVSPTRVPQLADAAEFLAMLGRPHGVEIRALVPNVRGAERAIEAGADTLVFVLSASDAHGRRNLNRTAAESLVDLSRIVSMAREAQIGIAISLSVAFGCPFEGNVPVTRVMELARRFEAEGVTRVSFCDTTGMAAPPQVDALARGLVMELPQVDPAFHFHNTRGLALAGVLVALQAGIARFESSVGGLGGCPFAPDAAGNACTEDMVHMLHEMGIGSGLDLDKLITASLLAEKLVGHELDGQVMKSGPRLRLSP